MFVSGQAALDKQGQPILEEMGIEVSGEAPAHTFLHAREKVANGLADYGYVMYEAGFKMKPTEGAETLVQMGEAYFQRDYNHFSGHSYTPEDLVTEYAAVVKNNKVITASVPLIEAYGKHAAPNYRILLGNCIKQLIPEPLIKDGGPSQLETTVVRKDENIIVHLISFCPERRADNLDIVEDPFLLVEMPISVKNDKQPKRVFLAPNENDLEFEYKDGYVHTRVTVLDGHKMLVVEN